MRRVILSSMAVFLVALLMLSGMIYAVESPDESQVANFEIGKQLGIKGKPDNPGKLPKGGNSGAATGILGEEVSGERYAVVIGISDYPGEYNILQGGLDLFYCDDDAVAMRGVLMDVYGFEEDNITLLLGPHDVDYWEAQGVATNGVATREAILNAINDPNTIDDLADKVEEGDEVVFFFSGHGTIQSGHNLKGKKSKGGNNVGIVTWNDDEDYIDIIWDYDLQAAFEGFNTERIIYIFDCCNAGGMTELEGNGVTCMSTTENGTSVEYGEAYGPPIEGLGQINHGLFTYFFVVLGLALQEYSPANVNGDEYVTAEEAYDFAKLNLEMLSRSSRGQLRQIPNIVDNFDNDLLL
jgi:hypothetical protein